MRVWMARLRTLLAALATVCLLWALPSALVWMRPAGEEEARGATVLRVWVCEDWTGTGLQWLAAQSSAFERSAGDVRIVLRRAQPDDWAREGVVAPDLLLFAPGAVSEPQALLVPLCGDFGLQPALAGLGVWRGEVWAVPVCLGGTVRLVNDALGGEPQAQYRSEQDFQDFVAQKTGALVGDLRLARRVSALQASGKGPASWHAEPWGGETDCVLMAAATAQTGERAEAAQRFLRFLLDDAAQDALCALGLLPVTQTAQGPDADAQPLLDALKKRAQIPRGAFD